MTTSQSKKFAQALASDRLLVLAECYPPRSGDAEAVRKLAAAIPAGIDAVLVSDNPDGIYGSALACAALLTREGREPMVTMSARDRNRIALQSDALGALRPRHQRRALCERRPSVAGSVSASGFGLRHRFRSAVAFDRGSGPARSGGRRDSLILT